MIGLSFFLAAIAAPAPQAPPAVVPSIREWTGRAGTFAIGRTSRIVVGKRDAHALLSDARTFANDLAAIVGRSLPVVSGVPRNGDIVLRIAPGLEPQGYRIAIDDAVSVAGGSAVGAFYAEQTLEQMFKISPERRLPRGSAHDWPDFAHRGVMLDLGRHFYTPSDVERQIRTAAWLKLNDLHLHLTDWSGFRIPTTAVPKTSSNEIYDAQQIGRFVALARRYHVTLTPEIDVPGHATALTAADPRLRFSCPSMDVGMWPGVPTKGWTLDITKPHTTAVVTKIVEDVARLFPYSPIIHLGGDEYPGARAQQQCPELVAYAKAHGFATTEDAIVAWQNTIAGVVKKLGRRAEIWNWWERQGATIAPDRDVIINAWTGSPRQFVDAGYDVIVTGDPLYVTPQQPPGGMDRALPPDADTYERWKPLLEPHVLGYETAHWGDYVGDAPDAYMTWFGARPDAILAERLWGGPRSATNFAFEDRLDAVGSPPGIPDLIPAGARQLVSGVAPARVFAIRFAPANATDGAGRAAIGGRFEGCVNGPDRGCRTIATIVWRPNFDWQILTIENPTPYRWFRYVPPTGATIGLGRVQYWGFYGPER